MKIRVFPYILAFVTLVGLSAQTSFAQCPQFYEDAGTPNVLSLTPNYYGCGGSNYLLNVMSNVALNGAFSIDWGDGSAVHNGTNLAAFTAVPHNYIFPPSDTFIITITANGCTAVGFVAVEEPVTAAIQVPDGGLGFCAPKSKDFINASLNTSITTEFTWEFGDGTGIFPFPHTNAGDTIQHAYAQGSATCLLEVTLTAENYCTYGSPSTATFQYIKIWDIDKAAITATPPELCYPDTTFTFMNTSEYNCTGPGEGNTTQRYERWNFGQYWGNTTDSIIDWLPRLGIPRTLGYPGVGVYNVTLEDSNFCGVDIITIQVEIVSPPTAAMTASDDTICVGETITFQNNSTGGADNFSWNFEGTWNVGTGPGDQTYTYNTPGSYTVYFAALRGNTGCGDTVSVDVEVLPSPTAGITVDKQNGCDSLIVAYNDNSTGAPVSWHWDFGNGDTSNVQNPGSFNYNTSGNYTASLTVTNALNCSNTATQPIDVYETPVPIFSPTSVCVNQPSMFIDSSTSAPGDPIISWDWQFGNGDTSTAQNPIHTYTVAGPYTVIFSIATAHCAASDVTQVIAEELPIANFSMDTTYGCAPLLVNFTNTSSVNSAEFYWDFGDGDTSTVANPVHTFLNSFGFDTTYTITLISYTAFGCTDTIRQTVEVYPNPTANFTDISALIKCSPAEISFVNLSSGGATSYLWNLGNGNISTDLNPIDTFYNTGNDLDTVTTKLIAYTPNGCTDTTSRDFIIFPKPGGLPPFIDSGCTELEVTMPEVVGAVNYSWNFGDNIGTGTGGSQPTHTYTNLDTTTKTFVVTLWASSGANCKDTSSGIVRVYHKPLADIAALNATIGCQPMIVDFINTSQYADAFHWDFGNGIILDTALVPISHQFFNSSDTSRLYNVRMTAETQFGCSATDSVPVQVHPSVIADFEGDTIGCSPFGASFSSLSSPAAAFWAWDFGDGGSSTSENPIHGYINNTMDADTHIVRLIASSIDGCSDTAYSQVVVYPSPTANFSINPPSNTLTYPDTTFSIQNLDLNWSYLWNFGDGDTSTAAIPGNKAYTGWGSFVITLVAYEGFCTDTMVDTVTILPPVPIADFGEKTEGCEDLTVEFVNKSKYGESYQWRFTHSTTNAAQSSVDKDPVITFTDPGQYNVILVVTGEGGSDEKIEFAFIEVYEQPRAAFTVAPQEVFIPNEKIVCFNNSRGEDLNYQWDFGDGSASNQENPEHYYTAEGEYTIVLIASNSFCSDTAIIDEPVLAKPSGGLNAPNAFTPNTGQDPGTNGGLDISGGNYDYTSNDVFFPKVIGEIKDYEFMIFNKWGEMLFRTDIQTVGWTGWYRDRLCQQDVYVYKVKATMVDNSETVLVGDLTLLR